MNRPEDHIFIKYFSGQSSEEEIIQLHDWLDESEENKKEFFDMEKVYREVNVSSISDEQIDRAERKLFEKVRSLRRRNARIITMKHLQRYIAAAMIIILAGVAFLWNENIFVSPTKKIVVASSAEKTVKVMLPDGTKVWLNVNSQLEYPEKFNSDVRAVELMGEAYFEVAKDKAKPFIVESNVIQVKVFGTKFDMKDYSSTSSAEVSLIEGSVGVKAKDAGGMIVLSPGQKACMDKGTRLFRISEIDANIDAIWHDGMIPFTNANIISVARTLEKVYGVKFNIDRKMDFESTYTGAVKRKDDIDSVMNLLKNTIPMKYTIEGKVITIRPQ